VKRPKEYVLALIDALMEAYPPDMTRSDGTHLCQNHLCEGAGRVRACYSTSRLVEMLNDSDLVHDIAYANVGEPLWPGSVRNFLIAKAT
jgi:hypothetical protein